MLRAFPATTSEQRQPLYEDVETLITSGFLSHPVMFGVTPLALRTLGPGDTILLRARVAGGSGEDWRVWATASALWLVNGVCLLDEPHATPRVARMIRALPPSTRDLLFTLVLGLFARATRALEAVEPYCYENLSRFRWRSYGGHPATAHVGIPGADRLGTNYVQRMWTFYNEIEDQRITDDTAWEGFKLVTSSQAPKGIKKIDQRDKQLKSTERERRQKVQDEFYYKTLGLWVPPNDKKKDGGDGIPVFTEARTPEELAEVMYRWVKGEEDSHDKIISAHKQQVIERYKAECAEREQRVAFLRAREVEQLPTRSMLVGYTPDQLQKMLRGRQPGLQRIYQPHKGRDFVYDKYLKREPEAGRLRAVDGRLVVATEEGTDRLGEEVAGRRVPFYTEPVED